MNPDRLARVFDVFKRSLDLDADRRAAFVASECADDVEVRDEVTKMLAHHAATGSFLEPPDAATMAAAAARVGEPEERRRYGEFELIEAMPRGGMGVVHRAYQPSLDRVVALKILGARFAPTQVEIDRFRREARAVAKLDHPGIVKLFQVGETDGDHWFAMEFVDGRNLQQELAIAKGSSPGDARWSRLLPDLRSTGAFATVATLVAAAADAIQHAHEHGIVHRDIKPSNLLLDRTGRLRVADFGLAKDESLGSLTNTGDVAGTAAYMSPEQAHVTKAEVDHRTDIYSLGVVLYELLTLTRPYEGKTSRDIIDRIGAADPPPVRKVNPRVPRDLALVCEKAMSREPADRYPTAKEFAEDLRRFLGHEAVEARGVGWWTAAARPLRRHRRTLSGLALAAAAASIALVLRTYRFDADGVERVLSALDDFESRSNSPDMVEVRRILDDADRVRRNAWFLPAVFSRRIERLHSESTARAAAELRDAEQAIAAGLGNERSTELAEFDAGPGSRLRAGLTAVANAALATGRLDADMIATMDRVSTAELSVETRGEVDDAVVVEVFPIDPFTDAIGSGLRFGTGVRVDGRLPPGLYRVQVRGASGAFSQTDVELSAAGTRADVRLRLSSSAVTERAVVRVAGSTYRTRHAVLSKGGGIETIEVEHDLPEFEIDAAPVTNRDYVRFMEDTDTPEPRAWTEDRPADFLDRPVAFLTIDDARAYARWEGKRVPIRAEWELAIRGPRGRRFPWGDVDRGELDACNLDRVDVAELKNVKRIEDIQFEWYCENVRAVPVASAADSASGIRGALGNLAEWTESRPFERIGDGLRSMEHLRYEMGAECSAGRDSVRRDGLDAVSTGEPHRTRCDLGLRLVRSTEPLRVVESEPEPKER